MTGKELKAQYDKNMAEARIERIIMRYIRPAKEPKRPQITGSRTPTQKPNAARKKRIGNGWANRVLGAGVQDLYMITATTLTTT